MTTLEEQIRNVLKLREDVAFLQTAEANLRKEFREAHQELYGWLDKAKQDCLEAEQALRDRILQALRDRILQAYTETGSKASAPGVGIRIITKLIYDGRSSTN